MKKMLYILSLLAVLPFAFNSQKAESEVIDFVCEPGGSEGPTQTLRNFFGMAMGFPGETEYECFHQDNQVLMDFVGQEGLIGGIDSLRSVVVNALVAASTLSITSCDDVPEEGTLEATIEIDDENTDVEFTFSEGSRVPPADYEETSAYDKAIQFAYENEDSNTVDIQFEFHCDRNSMFVKKTITDSNDANVFTSALYVDTEDASDDDDYNRYIDFYFADNGEFDDDIKMAIQLRINTEDEQFKLWQTRTGFRDNGEFAAYRFGVTSNYTTQESTVFYHDVSSSGYTSSDFTTQTNMDSQSVVGDYSPTTGNGDDMRMGCFPNFSTASSTITASTACTGLALSEGPAYSFGSTSKPTMLWVEQNLETELGNL